MIVIFNKEVPLVDKVDMLKVMDSVYCLVACQYHVVAIDADTTIQV